MSYEYRLVFAGATAMRRVMDALAGDAACVAAHGAELWLKDPALCSEADYDVRLMRESERSLWLQVNVRSDHLHARLCDALGGASVLCLEDGDDREEVTLGAAFRVR